MDVVLYYESFQYHGSVDESRVLLEDYPVVFQTTREDAQVYLSAKMDAQAPGAVGPHWSSAEAAVG